MPTHVLSRRRFAAALTLGQLPVLGAVAVAAAAPAPEPRPQQTSAAVVAAVPTPRAKVSVRTTSARRPPARARAWTSLPLSANSVWGVDISRAPLAGNSALVSQQLASQVAERWGGVAAFNAYQYNVSLYVATARTPKVTVRWTDCQKLGWTPRDLYGGAAHFVNVPIPAEARAANGTDREMSIYDPSQDKLWEFWKAERTASGWQACWGGRVDGFSRNKGVHAYPYGVSASGLVMTPGMISLADVRRGRIDHALYLAMPEAENFSVVSYPATRADGWNPQKEPNRPIFGQRARLDPTIKVDSLPLSPVAKMVAKAAQRYGFIVSESAGAVGVIAESGAPEQRRTGVDPWSKLLDRKHYLVMKDFPWNRLQWLPKDWGKPVGQAGAPS